MDNWMYVSDVILWSMWRKKKMMESGMEELDVWERGFWCGGKWLKWISGICYEWKMKLCVGNVELIWRLWFSNACSGQYFTGNGCLSCEKRISLTLFQYYMHCAVWCWFRCDNKCNQYKNEKSKEKDYIKATIYNVLNRKEIKRWMCLHGKTNKAEWDDRNTL